MVVCVVHLLELINKMEMKPAGLCVDKFDKCMCMFSYACKYTCIRINKAVDKGELGGARAPPKFL